VSVVDELAGLLEEISGHRFDVRECDRLTKVAEQRARVCGRHDLADYVRWLCDNREDPEWRRLLSRITISESYLFRAPQQLRAISEVLIPELIASRPRLDELRIWSAGCAKGEEAITLAVVMTEMEALRGISWTVHGTDVDESALAEARNGEYGRRAMSRVPPRLTDRHFDRDGDRFRARPHIMARVSYRRLNLMERPLGLPAAFFDFVLLRNVLIYFSPRTQHRVVGSVARTLAPDGSLFLGPSESLRAVRTPLVPRHFEDCYCYRLPSHETVPASRHTAEATVAAEAPPSEPPTDIDLISRLEGLLDGGDRDGAREAVCAAVERSPEDASLHGLQGWMSERSGNSSAAVASYRAALYLEPSLVQVRFLYACCLWRLGRHERARHELRTVMSELTVGRAVAVEGLDRIGAPTLGDLGERCRHALESEPEP
jgi:chemotaxis protein methyltransferase CheR